MTEIERYKKAIREILEKSNDVDSWLDGIIQDDIERILERNEIQVDD
jgi:hypothetical protein